MAACGGRGGVGVGLGDDRGVIAAISADPRRLGAESGRKGVLDAASPTSLTYQPEDPWEVRDRLLRGFRGVSVTAGGLKRC